MQEALARCSRELSPEDCYRQLAALGMEYGPEFRGLRRLRAGPGEAVAELHCASARRGPYQLAPNLLDSALQLVAVLAAQEPSGDAAPLPAAIRSIKVWGALKDRAVCHATLEKDRGDGTRIGRVRLYDPEGATAVEVEGLVLRPPASALGERAWARGRVYEVAWEPRKPSGERAAPASPWLWIAPDAAVARAMAAALGAQGRPDPVVAWPPGSGPQAISWRSPAPDAAGWQALLDASGAERAVWCVPALRPEDVAAECARALELCQAAIRARAAKVLVTTFGAHDAASPDPAQAALWGLFRTFAREHPDRWGGLLDLPAPLRSDARRVVALALEAADAELALRGGALHEPRIRRLPLPPEDVPRFRADAAYLVTGGLGGVGLALAGWLVERGAGHLVLMGRRAPAPEAAGAVAALERRGAKVRVVLGDAARAQDVARALAEPAALGWPGLKGVFHLAAALADAPVHALDEAKLRAAIEPKLGGAWQLALATRSLPLDHFVLFSSIAALGTAGQAGYAAANAFLDALAHHRRALGLPALSVGFGAFADVGAAARLSLRGVRGAPGVEPMPPLRALDAMGALLTSPRPHALVAELSWPAFAGGLPAGSQRLYDAQLEPAAAAGSTAPGLSKWLRTQPHPARVEALEGRLKALIADLLGVELSQAPAREAPLMQAGVDSLMSVQLRNALRAILEVDVPVTVMFDNPTIAHLADHLASAMGAEDVPAPSDISENSLETVLSELENLSEEEAERRLREEP